MRTRYETLSRVADYLRDGLPISTTQADGLMIGECFQLMQAENAIWNARTRAVKVVGEMMKVEVGV